MDFLLLSSLQTVSEVDRESGTVCGLMEALDVPMSASKVVTFWEGEVKCRDIMFGFFYLIAFIP